MYALNVYRGIREKKRPSPARDTYNYKRQTNLRCRPIGEIRRKQKYADMERRVCRPHQSFKQLEEAIADNKEIEVWKFNLTAIDRKNEELKLQVAELHEQVTALQNICVDLLARTSGNSTHKNTRIITERNKVRGRSDYDSENIEPTDTEHFREESTDSPSNLAESDDESSWPPS
uniref:Uncharacterized protein n=1 Tax=Arion vulgaris TaxID=1028688 RepID=A0A0B7BSD7_9EUPU